MFGLDWVMNLSCDVACAWLWKRSKICHLPNLFQINNNPNIFNVVHISQLLFLWFRWTWYRRIVRTVSDREIRKLCVLVLQNWSGQCHCCNDQIQFSRCHQSATWEIGVLRRCCPRLEIKFARQLPIGRFHESGKLTGWCLFIEYEPELHQSSGSEKIVYGYSDGLSDDNVSKYMTSNH